MSYTTIPDKVKFQIWLRAGGRCEYRGCNEPLWKDQLTLVAMNRAYLAHIIADSPHGPRGHPVLSNQLKDDPSNIMLLCDTHHRLVDREQIDQHPIDLLRQYKQEHEERVERQTGIQTNLRTHILLFGTQIGDRRGFVNYEQAHETVLPERYPADEVGIRVNLSDIDIDENDPEFWSIVQTTVTKRLQLALGQGIGPSGKPLNHFSIFALAPIPALIVFGAQLGDIISADVYQRHRDTQDWKWKNLRDQDFNYIIIRPDLGVPPSQQIALNLSLSGNINESEIEQAIGQKIPTYKITLVQPHRDFLQAKEQLELFRGEWLNLLSEIREKHGEKCEIHLFPAIPNSIAVEIGRCLFPKVDPTIIVYRLCKKDGCFKRTLTI